MVQFLPQMKIQALSPHLPGKTTCTAPREGWALLASPTSGRLAKPYSVDAAQSSGLSELGRGGQETKAGSCPSKAPPASLLEALAPSPGLPL